MNKPTQLAVVRVTLGDDGEAEKITKRVKLCNNEDQALAELERQAMSAVASDGSSFHVRRGDDWIKVSTHTADGSPGPTHYFSIEPVTESTA